MPAPLPTRKFSALPLVLAILALLVVVGGILFLLRLRPWEASPNPDLADLGTPPDWSSLERYDGVLTRSQFETALGDFYTLGPEWKEYFLIDDRSVAVLSNSGVPMAITFAPPGSPGAPPPRRWRPAADLPPAPADKPLAGLRIAIDPGHIGGAFAKLEERWYRIGKSHPVAEGDLTLTTARILKPRLEALGAEVRLVRDRPEPVTEVRPPDLLPYARRKLPGASREKIARLADRLFYRTSEIRARARMINRNDTFQPDLVLCLHFNAEAWGDAAKPSFSKRNHFHLILHGAYTPSELAHDDERFEMLGKIFQGNHLEEAAIAREVVETFREQTGLPPYVYPLDAKAIRIGPGLWARNLLANRLYQCPVLFLEPYVMNNGEVFDRIQAGDYEGLRLVAGKQRPSIYREYAEALTQGLVNYYRPRRAP